MHVSFSWIIKCNFRTHNKISKTRREKELKKVVKAVWREMKWKELWMKFHYYENGFFLFGIYLFIFHSELKSDKRNSRLYVKWNPKWGLDDCDVEWHTQFRKNKTLQFAICKCRHEINANQSFYFFLLLQLYPSLRILRFSILILLLLLFVYSFWAWAPFGRPIYDIFVL